MSAANPAQPEAIERLDAGVADDAATGVLDNEIPPVHPVDRGGLALDGTYAQSRDDWNKIFYGQPLTASQIVLDRLAPGQGYGALKGDLAEAVVEMVTPFRDRTLELLED